MQKTTNIHKIPKQGLNSAAINMLTTIDGNEQNSLTTPISSPLISSDVQKICYNIVKHVQEVSGGNTQISYLELYFSIDESNRLWLLLCSNLKVRAKDMEIIAPSLANPIILKNRPYPDIVDKDRLFAKKVIGAEKMLQEDNENSNLFCLVCLKQEKLSKIPLRFVYKWRGYNSKDKIFKNVVFRNFGNIKRIELLVQDKNWLGCEVSVCLACYLLISKEYSNVSPL